jgi:hypothetical protein
VKPSDPGDLPSDISKLLLLRGIKSAIPKKIKDRYVVTDVTKYGLVKLGTKWKKISDTKTSEIYRELVKTKVKKPTAISTLERKLNIQFDENLWQSFFVGNRRYTKNRHFRMWQYKILHGIHNTRTNLHKWHITTNSICELCLNNSSEDNIHYFFTCDYNENILRDIYSKVSDLLETKINLNDMEYITGIWTINDREKYFFTIDKLLFLGRMFIVRNRRAKIPINLNRFRDFASKQLELEDSLESLRPSIMFDNIVWDRIISELSE